MSGANHDGRPVHPKTGKPLEQRAHPGYYPGFRTLSQKDFWDVSTRKIVLARVDGIPSYPVFFT